MKSTKSLSTGAMAGALALALAATAAQAHATSADQEKCYGVVKAGKNDCGAADNSHGCMGAATTDGSGQEWVSVPKGLCEKLVGGSLTPAADAPAPGDDAAADGR